MTKSKIAKSVYMGYSTNSMFEPNSVDCKATKAEMNQFYQDMADLTHCPKSAKLSTMKLYVVDETTIKCDLIIEL